MYRVVHRDRPAGRPAGAHRVPGLLVACLMLALLLGSCAASSREVVEQARPRSGFYEVKRVQDPSGFRLGLLFRNDGVVKPFSDGTVLTNRTDLASDYRWQGNEVRFRLFDPYRKLPDERFYELRIVSETELEGVERIRPLGAFDQVVRDVMFRRVADFRVERREPERLGRLQLRMVRERSTWESAIRKEADARKLRSEVGRIEQALDLLGKQQVKGAIALVKGVPERPALPHRAFAMDVRKLAQDLSQPLEIESLESR